ncbi:hypothetical protein BO71DRAFT_417046 [Aspergillus ellipticus CBS 707.79]|uniref:Oxidoreductase-like domain-containing protein n=1 Tax=Aspergillus ellipticus CBS 707.79 TaxID=1448320 RepID=A0A319EZH4_9EURO|nr:hypothetical protein BO71DRAFT_417046 [Aspergillus ellipticus CBS 707.79]
MAIVFGTRLAGPGRTSRYNPGSTPNATWKTINGVVLPPRPEEPDNCCMSGCVHCVWDDYRDELEEWAGRLEQAKAKGMTISGATDMRHTPRTEVTTASRSMDDDGGGSETNWSVSDSGEDLFANIPVGIREFMKIEKKYRITMATSRAKTEIILNKANVALARSQRLVASWLPSSTTEDQANIKSEEELQREEDEIFTAVPETLGVGAPLPTKAADGSWNRTELDSNDKLRRQLLGRNYKKVMATASSTKGNTPASAGSAGRHTVNGASSSTAKGLEEDEDEEEGRTSLVGKKNIASGKKRKVDSWIPPVSEPSVDRDNETKRTSPSDDGNGDPTDRHGQQTGPSLQPSRGRKKATSFLDEILAERSKKRKKK